MNEAVAQRNLRRRFWSMLDTYINTELAAVVTELELDGTVDEVDAVYMLTDASVLLDRVERMPGLIMCAVVTPPVYRYGMSSSGSPSVYTKYREQQVDVVISHRATVRDFIGGYTDMDIADEMTALDISEAYLGAIINTVRKYVPCSEAAIRVELTAANIATAPMLERMGTHNTITASWAVSQEIAITGG